MNKLLITLLLFCSVALSQSSTPHGLQIPASHPRLWWTPERLAQARSWHASNPVTPRSDDYVGHAFRYLMTGNAASARTAINYALSQTLDDTDGTASNGARWYGEQVILIYDWCWDQMTASERSTLVTRWNGYLNTLRGKSWGGPEMPQNNYFWGYKRNMIEWGIATWGESTMAQTFLDDALVTRWQNSFVPHSGRQGRGGVMQEGSQYGRYLAEYATVPLVSATLLGRNMLEETQYFKEALFYFIYGTTPARTSLRGSSNSFFELFPSNDDHEFLNGATAERDGVGTFMSALADLWRDRPLGQWARQWVSTVNPERPAFVRAADRGGPAAEFSTLPLDFYAQGPQWLFSRSAWGSQATAIHLQMGDLSGVGHSHDDTGNWQIWRNGKWLSRESTGYGGNSITGWGGSGSTGVEESAGHNVLFVNGKGLAEEQNGPPVVKRLESQPNYMYMAVDLTPAYRNDQRPYPRPERDNAAVDHIDREFVFLRPLDTMVIFDRVRSNSDVLPAANVSKGFLAHFEQAPVPDGAGSYLAVNGDQALRITTLLPAAAQSRVITEGGRYGTYRLELETRGEAQSYFLNVLQARDATGPSLTSQVTENATAYVLTLQHPTRGSARIEFSKGAISTGGGISYSMSTAPTSVVPFTSGVQAFEVTDSGPVWAGSAPQPPIVPGDHDTTPPTISGVAATNLNGSSATITWTTDEAADGQIEYGMSTAYGQKLTVNTTPATGHSAQLAGLTAGTLYHYRIRSRDGAGNLALSGDFTFTTVGAAQYTITASAEDGGSISPVGSMNVVGGSSQNFTIAPQAGYRIADVTVNGSSVGAVSSYTCSGVTSDQNIVATFAQEAAAAGATAAGVTVNMTVHSYAGNGPANLVSNAIPFKPGALADARNVRILDGGVDVPLAVQVLGRWPQDNSIRSLLVQFNAPFSTPTKNYTLEIGTPRSSVDASLLPVTWDLPQKIFTLPAAYLSESLIAWEQVPHGQTGFPAWEQKQLQNYSRIENPGTETCVRYDHYYDAITTTYQMYVRTGDLRYLVNARRWALHHRRDQIWLDGSNIGHPRCDGGYRNNTRYTFPQGLVSDYFMFGDPEARRVSAVVVDNFYMDSENEWWYYKAANARGFWTEREPAFALNGVMAHYEATGDPRYLSYVRDRITSLHRMQVENGRRAWVHNLYDHDPSEGCASTDYGSSPWMSGLLLEAVIKYHKLTGDATARESILMAVDDLRSRYLARGAYANQSFVYLGCSAYRDGTPDLDNLISHAFGYAYRLTSDTSYRDLGTALLNTAVANGYAGAHKQFNQLFRSSGLFVGYVATVTTPPPADTTAPAGAVTSPTASQTVSGTHNATATASDNIGVAGVQFLIDGQPYGAEDAIAPYSVALNTTTLSNGNHTIVARVRDAAGNTTNSAGVAFTVNNNSADTTAPTVAVASPTANQTVSGTHNATATASDSVGVAGVQFLINGQPYGAEDTTAPYSIALNTTAMSNGTHTIAARARDAAGNSRTSTPVSFTVNNTVPDTTAPTVAVASPTANQTVAGTHNATATASDNVRVAGVQFLIDGQPYGAEDTTAPYSVALNTTVMSNGTHTIVARARDAAGNARASTAVTFAVSNRVTGTDTTPPTVAITAPTPDYLANGTITLKANASDNIGVTRVEFFINDVSVEVDTQAPFQGDWNSKSVAKHSVTTHTIYAVARDAAGNATRSAPVTFRVRGR